MSFAGKIHFAWAIAFLSLGLARMAAAAPHDPPPPNLPPACDRACLYGFIDRYLDALGHNDAARLPWARDARYSENNVALPVGDGMWTTTTRVDDYRLKFADVRAGEVGVFGIVEESNNRSGYALRLKIVDDRIMQAEAIVVRVAEFSALDGGVNPFASAKFFSKPILENDLTSAQRRPRERLISIANGYFDTLQLNDGTLFTQFDPQCERYENGILTTNNPAKTLGPVTAFGCEAQFKLGAYRFDDRVRGRRFPLVDEERGLVLAAGFIDHTGKLGAFKLTDGSTEQSPLRRPHSFCLMELFKIVDGRIRQVEAVFITVPYGMPSPWID